MLELIVKIQERLAAAGRDRGATAVEYGLMVALIAAAIVVTVTALGGSLNGLFTSITGSIGGA
jgi:pilus assembly protein Flp/PilA